jgi:hypothetical protein
MNSPRRFAAWMAVLVIPLACGSDDTVTLREYVDSRFEAQEKAVDAALAASDRRLDGMNEFRKSLEDMSRVQMPRSEAEQQFNTLSQKIELNRETINKKTDDLTKRLDARDEQARGLSQGWIVLVAVISVITIVIGAVVAVRKRSLPP